MSGVSAASSRASAAHSDEPAEGLRARATRCALDAQRDALLAGDPDHHAVEPQVAVRDVQEQHPSGASRRSRNDRLARQQVTGIASELNASTMRSPKAPGASALEQQPAVADTTSPRDRNGQRAHQRRGAREPLHQRIDLVASSAAPARRGRRARRRWSPTTPIRAGTSRGASATRPVPSAVATGSSEQQFLVGRQRVGELGIGIVDAVAGSRRWGPSVAAMNAMKPEEAGGLVDPAAEDLGLRREQHSAATGAREPRGACAGGTARGESDRDEAIWSCASPGIGQQQVERPQRACDQRQRATAIGSRRQAPPGAAARGADKGRRQRSPAGIPTPRERSPAPAAPWRRRRSRRRPRRRVELGQTRDRRPARGGARCGQPARARRRRRDAARDGRRCCR